jgi:hypothetical protein
VHSTATQNSNDAFFIECKFKGLLIEQDREAQSKKLMLLILGTGKIRYHKEEKSFVNKQSNIVSGKT